MRKQLNTYDYQVMRALKRKLYLVDLRGGKCEKCGYNKNLAAFDFHHIDPAMKESPLDSRYLSNSTMKWILSEFEKCLVVCANCHREEHNKNHIIEVVREKIKLFDENILQIRPKREKQQCIDCGSEINFRFIRCVPCNSIAKRKVEWPSFEILSNEIKENSVTWCSEKYKVSRKTISRWMKKLAKNNGFLAQG